MVFAALQNQKPAPLAKSLWLHPFYEYLCTVGRRMYWCLPNVFSFPILIKFSSPPKSIGQYHYDFSHTLKATWVPNTDCGRIKAMLYHRLLHTNQTYTFLAVDSRSPNPLNHNRLPPVDYHRRSSQNHRPELNAVAGSWHGDRTAHRFGRTLNVAPSGMMTRDDITLVFRPQLPYCSYNTIRKLIVPNSTVRDSMNAASLHRG